MCLVYTTSYPCVNILAEEIPWSGTVRWKNIHMCNLGRCWPIIIIEFEKLCQFILLPTMNETGYFPKSWKGQCVTKFFDFCQTKMTIISYLISFAFFLLLDRAPLQMFRCLFLKLSIHVLCLLRHWSLFFLIFFIEV